LEYSATEGLEPFRETREGCSESTWVQDDTAQNNNRTMEKEELDVDVSGD